MKYSNEIIIKKPIEQVISLFDEPENMKKWQPELISMEHMSGKPGEVGAKSKLLYKMGRREVEMIETITSRNLPMEFSGTYEANGVWNSVSNRFEAVDDHTTRWITENEFKMAGMMKVISFLMPGAFKKQTVKYMENFKKFAESR